MYAKNPALSYTSHIDETIIIVSPALSNQRFKRYTTTQLQVVCMIGNDNLGHYACVMLRLLAKNN